MSFLAEVSRSIQSTIIVNTSLSQLKNLRLWSHNERFLTFLPGQILFSYQPKNILAYFFAKIENQNLLSLAFHSHHPRLNCERCKHKNKDMFFFGVKVSWFSNKVNASHNHLTDFFFERRNWVNNSDLCLFMYMYYETMTDAFVLPFAATTPTTPPVKGKCLGPMYFKIQSSTRAFWAPGILVAKRLERWTCNLDLRIEARSQVPPWPLAGVVHGSPQLKSLATLVNSQLVPIVSYHLGLLPSLFSVYSQTSLIWTAKEQNHVSALQRYPYYRGPSELSVIERCPYYRGFRKERLDCKYFCSIIAKKPHKAGRG